MPLTFTAVPFFQYALLSIVVLIDPSVILIVQLVLVGFVTTICLVGEVVSDGKIAVGAIINAPPEEA
jgi:hypothetical protein